MSSIVSLYRVCSFSENEQATVLHKPPRPQSFQDPSSVNSSLFITQVIPCFVISFFVLSLFKALILCFPP